MTKEYDIVLCGVTGFAGKLAAEHLLQKGYPIKWGVCARNEAKAKDVLKVIGERLGKATLPPVEIADLLGDEGVLRAVVKKTRVILTTAGPFEKYSQTLVRLCAEEGVHYADITGESDFFRKMIAEHDGTAQRTGAKIVIHCGNDAIPWDLTVFEMSKLAQVTEPAYCSLTSPKPAPTPSPTARRARAASWSRRRRTASSARRRP